MIKTATQLDKHPLCHMVLGNISSGNLRVYYTGTIFKLFLQWYTVDMTGYLQILSEFVYPVC